jgi:catechol 2,3-dioxygenase-like lactoylglutathione lyase family enzyme
MGYSAHGRPAGSVTVGLAVCGQEEAPGAMRVKGLTFVGTSTTARERMVELVHDVLGLPSVDVEGSEHEFFALPDGSILAVGLSDGMGPAGEDSRTIGFLVDDLDEAVAELRAAGVPTDDEVSVNSRYRYIHFRAPDGHVYEFVEERQAPA